MFLPDINIWLALVFEVHSRHHDALDWFHRQEDETCCFCRITQTEFLQLASNPALFGADTCTLSDAWVFYNRFLSDSRVLYSQEPPGLGNLWRSFTIGASFSLKVWNDAYLAAFALSGGYCLVSFDKAFGNYHDLTWVNPSLAV